MHCDIACSVLAPVWRMRGQAPDACAVPKVQTRYSLRWIDELKEERRADRDAAVNLLAECLKLGAGHTAMVSR
jgi:hypothetical protein